MTKKGYDIYIYIGINVYAMALEDTVLFSYITHHFPYYFQRLFLYVYTHIDVKNRTSLQLTNVLLKAYALV